MSHDRFRVQSIKAGTMFPGLDYSVGRAVRAGRVVHLQGQTGIPLDGDGFVGAGDPAAQADNAMRCVKTLLEEAGAGMEDICKITTYVTDASQRAQVYPVLARHLGDVHPCSTGLVVKALAQPHIDFEIDVFAVKPDAGVAHRRIRKGTTQGGYLFPNLDFRASRAVRAGNLVFLTGATGLTLDGKGFVGKGDPAAQAENAMQSVKLILEEAGPSMHDICKVTTYVTRHSYRSLVYPVLARHMRGVNPVSTGLVVKALADPEIDFAIDIFAVVPEEGKEHQRIRTINLNRESPNPRFPGLDYGLARAVRAGDLVFLQGQTGRTFDGGFVGRGDTAAQADNAMRCVRALLEEADARMEDICKVITYVSEVSQRRLVYQVLAEHLRGVNPVSTGLVVEGFGHPDVDFEIDVFTVVPEKRS